ncbi:ABC transporter ATP-binding protein [Vibrio splendidus]|uniref:ABC transporter ATP-binding protein n=1 Tax=Vibrio splendidus TaxID=29497 RepID=UPI000E09381B|nr:ABC transporter ATP-binding protein [Vibrio splendidus]
MMSELAISCRNLTKTYPMYHNPKDRFKEALHPFRKIYHEDFYALRDVSFDIRKGETVGIIGQNGAGKSTLLKIITGVLTPTSGASQVNGVVSSILELGTGFNSELTGIENIYVNSSLMGVSKENVDKKLDQIIAFADIGEHINQPVRGYSSGMFARLAFSIAISIDPDILIVDEALAVGDMNFQAKCMTAMKRIQDNGTTILFVSHDISSVKSLCEKAIYIKSGTVQAVGDAGDIADLYMKEMREKLNQNISNTEDTISTENESKLGSAKTIESLIDYEGKFEDSVGFDGRVELFRYGTGKAKITNVELLDLNDVEISETKFNQDVKIRIYLKSFMEGKVSVNFKLSDDKKINIVSGSFMLADKAMINLSQESKHIVEYRLKLPLQKNAYSLEASITATQVENELYEYIDVVPNAVVFTMGVRPNVTVWAKVHLFPELSVTNV